MGTMKKNILIVILAALLCAVVGLCVYNITREEEDPPKAGTLRDVHQSAHADAEPHAQSVSEPDPDAESHTDPDADAAERFQRDASGT